MQAQAKVGDVVVSGIGLVEAADGDERIAPHGEVGGRETEEAAVAFAAGLGEAV